MSVDSPLPGAPATPWRAPAAAPAATIELQPYNNGWPRQFARIGDELRDLLGPVVRHVDHIGSTAVAGLYAQPVIDILLITPSLERFDDCYSALGQAHFTFHGDHGVSGRRYLTRQHLGRRELELHVYEAGHRDALSKLLVRDYLRAVSSQRSAFSTAKQRCVRREPNNRRAYNALKAEFLHGILRLATGRR